MLLRLTDGQSVARTYFIREFSKLCQIVLFEMQFLTGFETDGVDQQMGMDMRGIDMSGDHHFVVLPPLRQFQSNCVRFLRCDVFVRVEGLHEVEIHFAVAFVVL